MYHLFEKFSPRTLYRILRKFNLHRNKPDDRTLGQFLFRLEVSFCFANWGRYYLSVPNCVRVAYKKNQHGPSGQESSGVTRVPLTGGHPGVHQFFWRGTQL